MTGALVWLTGTKVGRAVAIAALVGVWVWWAVRSIRADARDEAAAMEARKRLKRTEAMLDAVERMGKAQARAPRDRRELLERLQRGDA